jgi:hypothetical protein
MGDDGVHGWDLPRASKTLSEAVVILEIKHPRPAAMLEANERLVHSIWFTATAVPSAPNGATQMRELRNPFE